MLVGSSSSLVQLLVWFRFWVDSGSGLILIMVLFQVLAVVQVVVWFRLWFDSSRA